MQGNQPKEKRRRLMKEFRHLIPNVKTDTVIITMNAAGNVRMGVLDKTYSLQQKNESQVATTITETRTISFNLPGDIVQDHDFKLKNDVAFSGEGNVEFVYNIKSKICNGK